MIPTKAQQLFFMQRALHLGEAGRRTAPPNPWVGCLLVKEGTIVGQGYHVAPGEPHAEVVALRQAGAQAEGSTAYVTLEPCAHQGRTPPCTHALIEAKIKRVIIPLLDPDPQVQGRGVSALEVAGIEVMVGIGKEAAERSLEAYLHHRRTQLPFCVLKSAVSIDGKSVAADGASQWITSEAARQDGHRLRALSQAILIGSQTALLDRPALTLHGVPGRQPLRVLIDSAGKVPPEGPLFDPTIGPTLVFTKQTKWQKLGIEILESQDLSLKNVLTELGKRGVLQLLVEGGAHLHTAFIKEGFVQRFYLYIGSVLLGSEGSPWLPNFTVSTLAEAPHWHVEQTQLLGDSVRLDYQITN